MRPGPLAAPPWPAEGAPAECGGPPLAAAAATASEVRAEPEGRSATETVVIWTSSCTLSPDLAAASWRMRSMPRPRNAWPAPGAVPGKGPPVSAPVPSRANAHTLLLYGCCASVSCRRLLLCRYPRPLLCPSPLKNPATNQPKERDTALPQRRHWTCLPGPMPPWAPAEPLRQGWSQHWARQWGFRAYGGAWWVPCGPGRLEATRTAAVLTSPQQHYVGLRKPAPEALPRHWHHCGGLLLR